MGCDGVSAHKCRSVDYKHYSEGWRNAIHCHLHRCFFIEVHKCNRKAVQSGMLCYCSVIPLRQPTVNSLCDLYSDSVFMTLCVWVITVLVNYNHGRENYLHHWFTVIFDFFFFLMFVYMYVFVFDHLFKNHNRCRLALYTENANMSQH